MSALIRPYEPADLGRILGLWERTGDPGDGLTVDQAVDLLGSPSTVALVAERDGDVAGMAVGSVSSALGTLHRLVVGDASPSAAEDAAALLDELEERLAEEGARKLGALAPDGALGERLQARGYRARSGVAYFERALPAAVADPAELAAVAGRIVPPGLWDELKGVDAAKEIIERRVILPLARPELAARHAVLPPRAIVLFGPPGTGKTTFAKGIASRLGWPFVELEPGELAREGGERVASQLAAAFDRLLALPAAVVFVDEVEDLASVRHEERRASPSVTNEFLRQIPRLREVSQHLLVCATNWISRLDPAFIRPGRFDYVMPVGHPDADARAAIWARYVDEITDEGIDLEALVSASDLFTPADIEFAARKAAQHAFEREHFQGAAHRAMTADFLGAIEQTRPTLSPEIVAAFEEDTRRFSRY